MNRKKGIIISIAGITIILLGLIGLTYAYFQTIVKQNEKEKSIEAITANLSLMYIDGSSNISAEKIIPSDDVYTKEFSVKNDGNGDVNYGVYLTDVINEFVRKDDIKYTLTCTSTKGNNCNGVDIDKTFPSGISELVNNIIKPDEVHEYELSFTYKDSGTNQSIDMAKDLSAKVQIYAETKSLIIPYESETLAYNIINNVANKDMENGSVYNANISATNLVNNVESQNAYLALDSSEHGDVYYFRGPVKDNYLEYAGMCWRIVSLQSDGSIKLILASESSCAVENLTESSGLASNGQGDLMVGHFGYKNLDVNKLDDYINSEGSYNSIKFNLNKWIGRTITGDNLDKLKDEHWCIGNMKDAYEYTGQYAAGEIVGDVSVFLQNQTAFHYLNSKKFNGTKTPSHLCEISGYDGEVDTNKVGTLTMDEVVFAGGGNATNTSYYLNDNINASWYLINPSYYAFNTSANAYVSTAFYVEATGKIHSTRLVTGGSRLRPSVTLKTGTEIDTGTGIIGDPYKIK